MEAPPLTAAEIEAAERQFGVVFPGDYRDFLRTVSAGGDVKTPRLVRGPDGWSWAGDDRTDLARLAEPFRDRDAIRLAWADLDAREPSRDEAPTAWQAWDGECEAVHALETVGALFLATDGISRTWLAVSGPYAGTLWFDMRATADRIVPITSADGRAMTFAEWYRGDDRALHDRLYRC
ncbi:SMI1/KNR4 family protein [Amycolatopsis sp. OK19-0408]|uniref:SMI1/KNR4 family protein n=1 Tax=Amycolatopsis iheyensis TaxID=2945988 RepID=A0A9X2NGT8_9PSEU|nr:SMI1/KNR4 family protein [Amycolatopsis iheyensis]MCR6484470.1 SMI1/KNR4 family protein [Amycolatopsis iheyensis]